MKNLLFKSKEHKDFYLNKTEELKADTYLKTLIYTVGICPTTRNHWNELYNEKDNHIISSSINRGWQTGTSLKVTRLAFNLYTDGTPTVFNSSKEPNVREAINYSVSDIFCCEYADYFVQSLKLRYKDYFLNQNLQSESSRQDDKKPSVMEKLEKGKKLVETIDKTNFGDKDLKRTNINETAR